MAIDQTPAFKHTIHQSDSIIPPIIFAGKSQDRKLTKYCHNVQVCWMRCVLLSGIWSINTEDDSVSQHCFEVPRLYGHCVLQSLQSKHRQLFTIIAVVFVHWSVLRGTRCGMKGTWWYQRVQWSLAHGVLVFCSSWSCHWHSAHHVECSIAGLVKKHFSIMFLSFGSESGYTGGSKVFLLNSLLRRLAVYWRRRWSGTDTGVVLIGVLVLELLGGFNRLFVHPFRINKALF